MNIMCFAGIGYVWEALLGPVWASSYGKSNLRNVQQFQVLPLSEDTARPAPDGLY
jgi:hypothetical protein